jgi:hypothetical protein
MGCGVWKEEEKEDAQKQGCTISGRLIAHTTKYCTVAHNTVGYARTNVIGSRTSFVIASLRSSIH